MSIFKVSLLMIMFGISSTLAPADAQSALANHDTQQAIDISAEDLNADNKLGRASFTGNVIVKQGGMTLKSEDLLVFYSNPGGNDAPEINRLDATGSVELVSISEQVRADWGIYDVEKRLITFGGNVILTRGENILNGDRLELNLITGFARLDGREEEGGRVRGSFGVPGGENDDPN